MANKTLVAFVVWTATMLMTTEPVHSQTTACAPDCSTAVEGDKVRVPWNCAQYAVCVDLHGDGFLFPADPVNCPEGEYFEPGHDIPRCDPADGADPGFCGNLCDPCDVQCTAAGELSPDPNDCSIYHVCISPGGSTTTTECSGTTNIYYDFINGQCQGDQSRCFNQFCSSCVVHCFEESHLPDPYDCTKYYYCNPPQLVHGSCPPGELFDRTTKACSLGITCVEDCV